MYSRRFFSAIREKLMAESKEELKEPLESQRGEWKSWLKTQHSEN